MINYYLANGKNGKSNALKMNVDGNLQRNFIDIASLDLETLKIKRDEAKEILLECNKDIDLSGNFYDVSYPHKQREIKTYPVMFDLNTDNKKVNYYYDKLREFAEERDYKKKNGDKIQLDDTVKFEKFVRELVYDILNANNPKFIDYESMLAAGFKAMIRERNVDFYNKSIENYINARIYKLKSFIGSYTQLRLAIMTYSLYLLKENYNMRTKLSNMKYWETKDLKEYIPEEQMKKEQKQMTLEDYFGKDLKQLTLKKIDKK